MKSSPRKQIGPYRILGRLGKGGMGTVYRAQHLGSGEVAAVKTVPTASQDTVPWIRREIQALARIRHPGIVRILEDGTHNGLPWYAMELLEGVTLRQFVKQHRHRPTGKPSVGTTVKKKNPVVFTPATRFVAAEELAARPHPSAAAPTILTQAAMDGPTQLTSNPLPSQRTVSPQPVARIAPESIDRQELEPGYIQDVLTIVRRLCPALQYLHGEGLIHRDLKPDNILIVDERRPVIVDFGLLSRFGGRVSRESLEIGGQAIGTPHYIAPEQARGLLVDARADLYALGCILYELLADRTPFDGPSIAEIIQHHLRTPARPPSHFVEDLDPALDRLILRLLAKDPRDRLGYAVDVARVLQQQGAEAGARGGPKPRPYLYRPGLAGRDEALATMELSLDDLIDFGRGGMFLIGGESGIGKTRLAIELAAKAERSRLQVVTGECFAFSLDPNAPDGSWAEPLAALRKPLQLLADLCRAGGREETDRLLGPRGRLLALFEPAIAQLPGQSEYPEPARLQPPAARWRLLNALTDTFTQLCSEQPVMLLLDDLHWADELTLELLQFLLASERLKQMPLLVVGTYRTEQCGALLKAVVDRSDVQHLLLRKLDQRSIGTIVSDMLAVPTPPPAFVRFLTRSSGGNPFFVAEYLRTAIAVELLTRDESGRWQVPDPADSEPTEQLYASLPLPLSLRELVERRLGQLPERSQKLAELASVLGREFREDRLSEAALNASLKDLDTGLQDLVTLQILERTGEYVLRFVHDKLREVAESRIPETRRAPLHRAVGEALEQGLTADSADHFSELAYHWRHAGEIERSRPYALAGARYAADRYSHEEAERLYNDYFSLTPGLSEEGVLARCELALDVLHVQGRNREAIEMLQQAHREALDLRFHAGQAVSLQGLSTLNRMTGKIDEAREMSERALALWRILGARKEEGKTLSVLASSAVAQGRLDEGRELFKNALAVHQELRNERDQGIALSNLAVIYQLQGEPDKSRELQQQALDLHRRTGNLRSEGITHENLGALEMEQGRPEEAKRLLSRSLEILRKVGDRQYESASLVQLARLERRIGHDLERPALLLSQAERILRQAGDQLGLILCLCEKAHLQYAQGSAATSWREIRELVAEQVIGPGSDVARALARLERAARALDTGESLLQGEHPDDYPPLLRQAVPLGP